MTDYLWLIIGLMLAITELITGGFYLLMLGIATIPAWLAQRMGYSAVAQTLIYAFTALVLVYIVHILKKKYGLPPSANEANNLDSGHIVHVAQWDQGVGLTQYRGTQWQVITERPNQIMAETQYQIVRIDGTRLIVKPLS